MLRLFWLAMIGLPHPWPQLHKQPRIQWSQPPGRFSPANQSSSLLLAEEMPADKYSYHPTPDQWSFGKVTSHIAVSGNAICAMLSDIPAPQGPKVSETDSKESIVAAIKGSFEFCDKALANLTDAQMGDTITYFRGARTPRARALFELTDDLEDHYSQMAGYLRLSGMTPPSAQPKK
jgi:hypothetical protein